MCDPDYSSPKDSLPDLISMYEKKDGTSGTIPYRDIVTDLLLHAKKNLDLHPDDIVSLIAFSAVEVFQEESDALEGSNT